MLSITQHLDYNGVYVCVGGGGGVSWQILSGDQVYQMDWNEFQERIPCSQRSQQDSKHTSRAKCEHLQENLLSQSFLRFFLPDKDIFSPLWLHTKVRSKHSVVRSKTYISLLAEFHLINSLATHCDFQVILLMEIYPWVPSVCYCNTFEDHKFFCDFVCRMFEWGYWDCW